MANRPSNFSHKLNRFLALKILLACFFVLFSNNTNTFAFPPPVVEQLAPITITLQSYQLDWLNSFCPNQWLQDNL